MGSRLIIWPYVYFVYLPISTLRENNVCVFLRKMAWLAMPPSKANARYIVGALQKPICLSARSYAKLIVLAFAYHINLGSQTRNWNFHEKLELHWRVFGCDSWRYLSMTSASTPYLTILWGSWALVVSASECTTTSQAGNESFYGIVKLHTPVICGICGGTGPYWDISSAFASKRVNNMKYLPDDIAMKDEILTISTPPSHYMYIIHLVGMT